MATKAKMKEVVASDLAHFKKLAKAQGYTVRENTEAREAVRPYYLAEKGDEVMGAFSGKYPRDSWVLV